MAGSRLVPRPCEKKRGSNPVRVWGGKKSKGFVARSIQRAEADDQNQGREPDDRDEA